MNEEPRRQLDADPARHALLPKQLENLRTCCFVIRLELGCKLIAIFEAVCGLLESIFACQQLSARNEDRWNTPQWKEDRVQQQPTNHNPQLRLFLGLVTLFSAQLLLAGITFKRKICVLIWLYVISFSTVFYMFYTLVFDCLSDSLIYDVISAALEVYYLLVVLSYYIQHLQHDSSIEDDFEVLYSSSELQQASKA